MQFSRWVLSFPIRHPVFTLLVRHCKWILNHWVRNDFVVELDNRVIKTSPYESHTGIPAPRTTSLLNRTMVGRRDDDDKQPWFQATWFLGLIAGSDEVIALHPDGVQRHHGEWRVSPLEDPESNLRELKSALALKTEVDWRTPECKTCQDIRYHRSWHSVECRERILPPTVPDTMWPVASTKRLLDTGADDARDDHESKRLKKSDDTVPMAQEPSSGSGVKISNLEAIRRADAEAEKALKRAKMLEERRTTKRQSATDGWIGGVCYESSNNSWIIDDRSWSCIDRNPWNDWSTHNLSSSTSSRNESPLWDVGGKFLPNSQRHDNDVQKSKLVRNRSISWRTRRSSKKCTKTSCLLEHTLCPVAG